MDRTLKATIQVECQQLLNRATLYMDNAEWEALAACYTEDAILFRPSDANTGIEGRPAILDSFNARPPRTSCHVLANTVFDIHSPTQVTAKSRIWLIAGEKSDALPIKAESKLMVGSFIDSLVYINDAWFIQQRKGTIELKYSYE